QTRDRSAEVVLARGQTRKLQERWRARLADTLRRFPMRARFVPLTRRGQRETEIVARLCVGCVSRMGARQPANRRRGLVRRGFSPMKRLGEAAGRLVHGDALFKPAQTLAICGEGGQPFSIQFLI